jgi:hypothetical protein
MPILLDDDGTGVDIISNPFQRQRMGSSMKTQIKFTCGCGKVFDIDGRPNVAIEILKVTIRRHSKDCDACG